MKESSVDSKILESIWLAEFLESYFNNHFFGYRQIYYNYCFSVQFIYMIMQKLSLLLLLIKIIGKIILYKELVICCMSCKNDMWVDAVVLTLKYL